MENTLDNEEKILSADAYELKDEEILERIILLGFKGDRELYERFCQSLRDWLPEGTAVSLRGSVVTNARHEDGTPFDSKGEGTSDLDVTLHGSEARAMFKGEEFYIPGLHSKPLGDKDPDIATPELDAFRRELQEMVGRPVNIHATSDLVLDVRHVLMGQPYFVIVRPEEIKQKDDA
jgi:hypothetical protein